MFFWRKCMYMFMDSKLKTTKRSIDLSSDFFSFSICRITIYLIWHVIEGRKLLIVRLRRQIVNVSVINLALKPSVSLSGSHQHSWYLQQLQWWEVCWFPLLFFPSPPSSGGKRQDLLVGKAAKTSEFWQTRQKTRTQKTKRGLFRQTDRLLYLFIYLL